MIENTNLPGGDNSTPEAPKSLIKQLTVRILRYKIILGIVLVLGVYSGHVIYHHVHCPKDVISTPPAVDSVGNIQAEITTISLEKKTDIKNRVN